MCPVSPKSLENDIAKKTNVKNNYTVILISWGHWLWWQTREGRHMCIGIILRIPNILGIILFSY